MAVVDLQSRRPLGAIAGGKSVLAVATIRRTAMPFILPMLATRLEDPGRLADSRYSAEPKLDGQRAQLHIRDHRTVHAFSRLGRELIHLPGLAWLRDIRWPGASAVLDGEAVAGDGSEGIQAVFQARHRSGNLMAF